MRRSLIVVLLVIAGVVVPPAQAGTYQVRACSTPSGVYPNRSWAFSIPSARWTTSTVCQGTRPELTINLLANSTIPQGELAAMTFIAPSGTAIRDFSITRQIYNYNPPNTADQPPPFIVYSWGGVVFSGGGAYDPATRDAVNATGQWYGYPQGAFDTGAPTITRATFPVLAGQPDASYLQFQLGCYSGTCVLGTDGNGSAGTFFNAMFGAVVTIADSSRPDVREYTDAGLYGLGTQGGDEGAEFAASDNVGIRQAELLDLTDPSHPVVAGRKTFGCNYALPRPCVNVGRGSVAASQRLPSGLRTLAIRVTDTAGNQSTTPARGAYVGGPLNGTNASRGGRLRAVFTRGGKTRRTVKPGGQPAVSVTLRDSAKRPIGGARIQMRSRQRRTGAHFRPAGLLTTDAKGRAKVTVAKGTSRELRFEYRTRVDDPSPALRARVLLGVRPRATLRIRPRHVGAGGRIRLSGRVLSRPRPRPGKLVVLQAFDRGRWRTFAVTRSHKRGRYTRAYRFMQSAGRTFRFRAHLPREGAYPYSAGNSHTVRVRVG
jgi:hypothetical protein